MTLSPSQIVKHDIHIKLKSSKFELLGELIFNMVLELDLAWIRDLSLQFEYLISM